MNFVIDTNIVINGFTNNELPCLALLYHFFNNRDIKIVVDYPCSGSRGVVVDEYFRNLKDNEAFQKWYAAISNGQIDYFSGKLNEGVRQTLINKGFHEPSDQTFVALSIESDKNLITEESDYGMGDNPKANDPKKQDVLEYLTNVLGLDIMDSSTALERLRSA